MFYNNAISVLIENDIKITEARKLILKVISKASSHISVDDIYKKVKSKKIGIATVYRTVKTLCAFDLLLKHDFSNKETLYEKNIAEEHHHHLIDIKNGKIIEFNDSKLDSILHEISEKLGYDLIDHKIEIYAKSKK